MAKDWIKWHADYDDVGSMMSERRRQVTILIRRSLDSAARGPLRVLSLCAGEARDLTDALADHDRRFDVRGAVVELDRHLASLAESNLRSIDANVQVVVGEAGNVATFRDFLPVDLLLLVGIFGNVSDEDVENTVKSIPSMCSEGATVIWTRHRRQPDLTPSIRQWFEDAGCMSLDFISPGEGQFAIGCERVTFTAPDRQPSAELFRFQD